jgi:hypothetical protein
MAAFFYFQTRLKTGPLFSLLRKPVPSGHSGGPPGPLSPFGLALTAYC